MRHNVAYWAGLFDGEGCVWWGNTPRVSITNTYLPILRVLKEDYGGALRLNSNKGRRCYVWTASGDEAMRFLNFIKPHLVIKRAQVDLVEKMRYCEKAERPMYDGVLRGLKKVTYEQ
jgi:hypothetical protein